MTPILVEYHILVEFPILVIILKLSCFSRLFKGSDPVLVVFLVITAIVDDYMPDQAVVATILTHLD